MLISEFGYNPYIQGEVRDLPFCLKQETLLDLSQTYQSTSPIPLLQIFEHPLQPFSFKRRWPKHSLGRMSPHTQNLPYRGIEAKAFQHAHFKFGYNSYIQGEVRDLPFCLKSRNALRLITNLSIHMSNSTITYFEHPLQPFSFKRRWAKHSLGRMSPHSEFDISRHRRERILTCLFQSSDITLTYKERSETFLSALSKKRS